MPKVESDGRFINLESDEVSSMPTCQICCTAAVLLVRISVFVV